LENVVTVRLATAADLPCLIELERKCATAAHWTEQQYQGALREDGAGNSGRLALVIDAETESLQASKRPSQILAFLIAHHLGPEWELENIVVDPAARRKGLGARLLGELVARARGANSESVFLEVRESNLAARALYQKVGFTETGRRTAYYSSPTEDAILCHLELLS
jgi:ribosomal-protein-alanine N-acetyltransferase